MRELLDFMTASARLALEGQLVKDLPDTVVRVAGAGALGTAVGVTLVAAGAPLWVGTLVGAGVGGFVTPYLLRDIKIA
jgi:ABC-type uncharacterized transport system permease subunit